MTRRRTSSKRSPTTPAAKKLDPPGGSRSGSGAGRIVLGAIVAAIAVAGFVLVPRLRAPRSEPFTGPMPARLAGEDSRRWSAEKAEFVGVASGLEFSNNDYLGRQQVVDLAKTLARPDLPLAMKPSLQLQFWFHQLRMGNVDGATATIEDLFRQVAAVPNLTNEQLKILHWTRALNYLRAGEVQNCIQNHNADCCILPLKGGGVHKIRTPAEEAQKSLLTLLEIEPDSLGYLWLLNITHQQTGTYPDGVPERYRIPPTAFASQYDIKHFPDIAPRLGVDTYNLCGGAITEDFDNDGFVDILHSSYDPAFPLTYYHNNGDGTFENRAEKLHLSDQLGGLNLIHGDYDNDGDQDVYVLRGAWLLDAGRIRNSLLRNDGKRFVDVSRSANVAEPAQPTQAATWLDYDNDGDLDLYVVAESRIEITRDGDYPSSLFRNEGNGTFVDVAAEAGVRNDRYCKGVTAGDYDNDGDMDLYLSNMGANRLYRNEGNGKFTDVAAEAGVTEPMESFATWFFDYDNDGWLDLWVGGFNSTIADVAADYLGRPHKGVLPRLYRNQGNGTFEDVSVAMGLNHPYLPMGANFGDLDNDGYLDFYLATGKPGYEFLMPNIMLRNDGARRFVDVTASGGFGNIQKGHGVAFADLDNDGDQDVYEQLGGFFPGDAYRNALFENPGHGNRFVTIRLVGTKTNRDAVGARLEVVAEGAEGRRSFHRAVGSVSSFGGSPRRQEVGLGTATRIAEVRVRWPVSGTTQVVRDVPIDSSIEITEGRDGFRKVPFKTVRFADTRTARR